MAAQELATTIDQAGRATRSRSVTRQILSEPLTVVGGLLVLLSIAAGLFWPFLVPYDPFFSDLGAALKPPDAQHLLGTDDLGRDVLSRVISGAAASLQAGVMAVALAILLGVPLGVVAGYLGGWADLAIMRVMDALLAFPALVLALGITAALGPSLRNVAIAIAIVYAPRFARLVRGPTLSLRTREFVEAARVAGGGTLHIIARHILPNASAPLVVQASLSVGFAIVAEASLSFLGLGVQPPIPSWGGMLKVGYAYVEMAPWIALAPGVVIALTVLGFMLLGDGISEAIDPSLRRATRSG